MRDRSITFRLPSDDYNWLALNAQPEVSTFLRYLVREAKRKDENRPLKVRIAETEKQLSQAKELFVKFDNIPNIDSVEMRGPINRSLKTIKLLEAKLAALEGKKA